MTIDYRTFPEINLVVLRAHGVLTGLEMMNICSELFASDQWYLGYDILYDYRDVEKFELSYPDVEQLARQSRQYRDQMAKTRMAVVADSDVGYGIARMWEAMMSNNSIEMMVCRKLEQACKWLQREPDMVGLCCKLASD